MVSDRILGNGWLVDGRLLSFRQPVPGHKHNSGRTGRANPNGATGKARVAALREPASDQAVNPIRGGCRRMLPRHAVAHVGLPPLGAGNDHRGVGIHLRVH